MSQQSKQMSAVESLTNTVVGFVLALVTWQLVGPLFGYVVNIHDNLIITSLFTVVSIIRGYIVRRFFNYVGSKE